MVHICLYQKYVKDKNADEPVMLWSRTAQMLWGRQWGSCLTTTSPAPLILSGSGERAQTSLANIWERTQWARDRRSKTLYSTSGTILASCEIQLSHHLHVLLAYAIAWNCNNIVVLAYLLSLIDSNNEMKFPL